jgi:hypothetical protein
MLSYLLMSGSARIVTCEHVGGVPRESEGQYDRHTAAEGVRNAAKVVRTCSKCREIASEWFREVCRRFVMFAEVRTCLQGCEVSVGCVRVCKNFPRV